MARQTSPLDEKLLRSRHSGFRGSIIRRHHSLTRIRFGASAKLSVLLLPLLFDFLLLQSLDSILAFWGHQFSFWTDALHLNGRVSFAETSLLGWHTMMVPYTDLPVSLPSQSAIWINVFAVILCFLFSTFLPQALMPITYLLRGALVIQGSASIFLLLNPGVFPLDLGRYVTQELVLGVYTLLIIPPLLALVYYIFDFAVWRKCVVTTLILAFFTVAIPFQYMLHAYILHTTTVLFMPVLYLLFGVLLDILMFIAMYAFGMSWQGDKQDELGKFA